jgi:nucleoid-associated protein Lsr2
MLCSPRDTTTERLEVAQRVQTILVDDLDGTELGDDGQTVRFGWLGADYTIDLSQANLDKFAAAITPYVDAGQRVGGRKTRSSSSSVSGNGQVDTKAVRKWAQSNGIELSSRGRVPADVIDKYKAAGN